MILKTQIIEKRQSRHGVKTQVSDPKAKGNGVEENEPQTPNFYLPNPKKSQQMSWPSQTEALLT